MCGIATVVGKNGSTEKTVEGLKRLEYRGYDSFGVGSLIKSDSPIKILKMVGKIGDVDTAEVVNALGEGLISIGHTRWATHGGVKKENCHPHSDCKGGIVVVHNGVIENYQELRKALTDGTMGGKHIFVSQTDTEVIPHLIEDIMDNEGMSFVSAAAKAAAMLRGRSAFVAVNSGEEEVVAVRMGSPLITGLSTDSFYIASDVNAFLPYTNLVSYLDDHELVVIKVPKGTDSPAPKFFDLISGKEVPKKIITIDWTSSTADKAGYEHFLIKEIMEQKKTVTQAIDQDASKIIAISEQIKNADKVFFVGCGTAYKVCEAAESLFSTIAGKQTDAVAASEFSSHAQYLTKNSIIIPISQSGETADTLEAIEVAKSKGAKVFSVLNAYGSTMMRISDESLLVNAGAERSVASTKATTAQLSVLTMLAYAVAGRFDEGRRTLQNMAYSINDMLNPRYEDRIKALAKSMVSERRIFIIGRGINHPMAEEAAIKLQETYRIPALGFAGGELKHGPLALIKPGSVCIALVANDESKAATLSNAMEIKARGGRIIGIAPEDNEIFNDWLKVPDTGKETSAIVNIIPVQMLAYYLSIGAKIDPDYPRNLAKSVTVK